jgi:branched-chain amino acid transport system ATP-binding protein
MNSDAVLEVRGVDVSYGHVPVVRGLNLHVERGEVVVMIGANGAGKTTTLQALAGEIPVKRGEVRFNGTPTTRPLNDRARAGLAYLPEGRSVFRRLSVLDNLKLSRGGVDEALAIAPELEPLLQRRAGLLSGGEQQILCLARLLAAKPLLLLADEMSLGLAPMLVTKMLNAARQAAAAGAAVLLVEQHAKTALAVADRAILLNRGRIVLADAAESVLANIDEVENVYLSGVAASADA